MINNKLTPNHYAKQLILQALDCLEDQCWQEEHTLHTRDMTDIEIDKIQTMLNKRIKGLYKYLGYLHHSEVP